MPWQHIALATVAILTLRASENPAPAEKRLSPAELEALTTSLELDGTQKAKLRDIQQMYDKKTAALVGIWDLYHQMDLALQARLTGQQRARQPEVFSTMRAAELETLAKNLGLSNDAKQRIAKLRADYEPKFLKLVSPTQQGQEISKEQRELTHKQVVLARADFLKAVSAELTEDQRAKLAVVLREYPGLPGLVAEDAALSFVLLAANLMHFTQPKYLDALAIQLDLSAAQKEQFQKAGGELGAKLRKSLADNAAAVSGERQAMEEILTDAQRQKWSEMRKANEVENRGPKENRLDPLETLRMELKLDEKQSAQIGKIHQEFAEKINSVTTQLWNEFHKVQLPQANILTAEQLLRLPKVLKAMREGELRVIAAKLDLSKDQKQRIARLCKDYQPKYDKLTAPTLQGEKVSKEEWGITHKQIAEARLEFLDAVGGELTQDQRRRLPAVLRQAPGLPAFVNTDASLAFVLLAAGLAHFSQPAYLDDLAIKLDLSAAQKEQFQKQEAELAPRLQQLGAQLLGLLREEREAVAKVLTDEQRTKWNEMRIAKGEEK